MNKRLAKLIQILVIIAMPFFLGFTIFQLSIGEAYPRFAYGQDSFPRDDFGWTQEQRLALALVAVDYLGRSEPAEEVIYLLEEQRLPGTDEPLYNEREIKHMLDVKIVADSIVRPLSWIGMAVVGVGLLLLMAGAETRRMAYEAVYRGGALTIGVLVSLGVFLVVGWNVFFVAFHNLFFESGTWTFRMSDSLIRLFPEKFWFDYGVLVVGSILIAAILVTFLGFVLRRQRAAKG